MKHYSLISNFYQKNQCSTIEGISFESLTDLIYSNQEKKIFFYDDQLFNKIIDGVDLNWEENQVLILAPNVQHSLRAPSGFNQHNIYSINYFTKIYSAFKSDIRCIFCAISQKNIIVNKGAYSIFEINKNIKYEDLISFCELNYQKNDLIDDFDQYAKRGGIVDIYPNGHKNPKRISFLYDSIEIKEFDIHTQRSLKKINKIKIETLQKKQTLDESLINECNLWEKYEIINKTLFINNHINNKKTTFPFQKINYSQFKKIIHQHEISYEAVNRLYGFQYKNNKIIAPEWFEKTEIKTVNNAIDMAEINIGDYVVHRDHGIGVFSGLKYINNNSSPEQELIVIKYQDNSNITVDINHLNKITFYASKNDRVKLDSLSSNKLWLRRKNNAKKNVQNIVNKFINAYVNRENSCRQPILADNDEENFIKDFEYMETVDQKRCWDDIKGDLRSSVPMDRLICGDVGFGKTELAIRSAYRYVSNNKRVIVLSPTTILCEQLFQSFSKRLNNYGVIIDRLSRLRTKKDVVKIKEQWINNKIDIIIGTHAVLYNDLYLDSSHLLIIDEEHRFGVRQKEKIKELNPSIDILTMSATPIPRTLNMALSGMKQISTLTSPPKNRKPIITNVNYFNEQLILSTINNEIIRKGQVYFVHNNVKTINTVVDFLNKQLPYLSIDYIHGQMEPKIIENTMKNFTEKQIDVLVCTSIIENGIDIPAVNTIIINNAHEFGLSQLYQIRGRVGRANKQAHALLIIPEKFKLTSISKQRLQTIEKYTSLGSGYKIANMDLTIRGGGSIFGYDQSGNIESVGYELVSKFINEYIDYSKPNTPPLNTKINFINKGIIPTSYISSTKIRLLIYRKIKSILVLDEINYLQEELIDRFGNIPQELNRLIEIQKLYINCQKIYINLIDEKKNALIIQFQRNYWEQKVTNLLNKINQFIVQLSINYEVQEQKKSLVIKLNYQNKHDALSLANEVLYQLLAIKGI